MKKENLKQITITALGIFFISFGLLAVNASAIITSSQAALWFCYWGLIIIGIGILARNSFIVAAQLNILAILLLIWTIDFFYFWITGTQFLGIADYFFGLRPLISQIISTEHLFTVPLALLALYLIKLKRKDFWKLSLLELPVIFFITRLLTSQSENINCVYRQCLNLNPELRILEFYPISWMVIFAIIVIITNIALVNLPFINQKVSHPKNKSPSAEPPQY